MRTSTTKVVGKRTRGRVATTASVAMTHDVGSYWIRRVQKMQWKVGSRWGILRQPANLLSKLSSNGQKIGSSCRIMIFLHWFFRASGSLKCKYDASNSKWIDVNSISHDNNILAILQVVCMNSTDVECPTKFCCLCVC